jgi:hypothetical protein
MYLGRVYVTGDYPTAHALQNSLFTALEKMNVIAGRRITDAPIGRQGSLLLARGIDPIQTLDGIVAESYKEFCRAKLGCL